MGSERRCNLFPLFLSTSEIALHRSLSLVVGNKVVRTRIDKINDQLFPFPQKNKEQSVSQSTFQEGEEDMGKMM